MQIHFSLSTFCSLQTKFTGVLRSKKHWKDPSHSLFYIKGLNFSQKGNGGLFLLISCENHSLRQSLTLLDLTGSVKAMLHHSSWICTEFIRVQI